MRLARVLRDGRAEEARVEGEEVVLASGRRVPVYEAEWLPPTQPTKVICVGFNYRDHAHELEVELPKEPLFFLKPPSALVAHGQPVVYPSHTRQLDYEGELAVVIGRRCRNIRPEDARGVILGYSILNDVTARDVQKVEKQWVRAKAFDGSAPYGPWVETEADPRDLRITTRVNGEVRQDSWTRYMIFDVFHLVAEASRYMTLEPGDVIATGTPPGVGPVRPGDVVEITVEGIGTLSNPVVAG
ncbi:MAG: fumarylacetoacetate hydrolase family protein [Armatimonadota bacterium]|nr:fumarylacetoacetate hydrolase family protein [Armatimonadota bacterium]MDR7431086.1 fumarylacetoacetate hydrolase family protein [Armatimonadota bacterium]MDR7529762.1 fumarylacetoacetate hydrolase family protein [Armatimonadota bacterium]MDR7607859.1 fumarylacetoacetate hydrolase family protein [Armatimonadota bacterium]